VGTSYEVEVPVAGGQLVQCCGHGSPPNGSEANTRNLTGVNSNTNPGSHYQTYWRRGRIRLGRMPG